MQTDSKVPPDKVKSVLWPKPNIPKGGWGIFLGSLLDRLLCASSECEHKALGSSGSAARKGATLTTALAPVLKTVKDLEPHHHFHTIADTGQACGSGGSGDCRGICGCSGGKFALR